MRHHHDILQTIEEHIRQLDNQNNISDETSAVCDQLLNILDEDNDEVNTQELINNMRDADVPDNEADHHEDVVHSLYQWHNNKKYRKTDKNRKHRLPDDYPHTEYVKAYKRRK